MSSTLYIGLDDTDILGSPGTGRVARGLAERLESAGFGCSKGVTRHQLLVDSRIKYTSHNSSLCITLETDRPFSDFRETCIKYMRDNFQEGADPGLCACDRGQVSQEMLNFGALAATTVLSKDKAEEVAASNGIFLRELGGTGDGIIGALAAVALRAGGNNGRYIELRGIRGVSGEVSVGELKWRTDVVAVVDEEGNPLSDAEIVDSLDWVRPSLMDGQPVLRVQPGPDLGHKRIWVSVERKKGHRSLEKAGT